MVWGSLGWAVVQLVTKSINAKIRGRYIFAMVIALIVTGLAPAGPVAVSVSAVDPVAVAAAGFAIP